ncbi:MAG TPA: hypothetical protein VH497_16155 [Vicinamibacterales bacterium]
MVITSARKTLGVLASLLLAVRAESAPARPAPGLPAPTGTIVSVSTEPQLQNAIAHLQSNTTILVAPGTYALTSTLYINGTFTNVALRGASGDADDVVLQGPGMTNAAYGNVPFGVWTGGNVQNVLIANLTIRDVYYHPIIFNAGTQSPRVYNVRLVNAGQQFIKSNPDGAGGGVNNGVVEYAVIEYDTTSRDDYTNGVDVHSGQNWIVRNSLFRNIRAPQGLLAGPAVLMWNGTANSIVEANTFIDCQREIALGLIDRGSPHDHSGGIVRNNFIYRRSTVAGDVAIGVFDSPGSQVLHNTVLMAGGYPNALEYRFSGSSSVVVANNLFDSAVQARDGATGTVSSNYLQATPALFVNASAGDLHLLSSAAVAIDKTAVRSSASADWDGQARPIGAAADLGADEWSAGTLPTTPTNVRIVGR